MSKYYKKRSADGWDAQLDYLKRAVKLLKLLKHRKSTFGFEILNEPEVYSISHYRKVGHYHDYMIKELRKITEKPLFFCWALPRKVNISIYVIHGVDWLTYWITKVRQVQSFDFINYILNLALS
jgi:hypothetical protein